jgi:predicted ATP-dependent serine protease
MGTVFKKSNKTRGKRQGAKKLAVRGGGMDLGLKRKGARMLGSVDVPDAYRSRITTGFDAMDQFLSDGGGLCPIQSITITAPRGGGKTTLWMQLLSGMRSASIESGLEERNGLYGSGEEFVEQLALAAERVNAGEVFADNLTHVEHYIDEIAKQKWSVVVIDSLPSLTTGMKVYNGELIAKDDVTDAEWKEARPVPKSQLENLAVQRIVAAGKENSVITVFILHLTKDGKVKGDSGIEHTVDTCLRIEVPKESDIDKGLIPYGVRLIQCDKNRFGGTGTVAFKLGKEGWDLRNPYDLAGLKKPENNGDGKIPGGERGQRKVREMQAIIDIMKKSEAKLTCAEILGKVASAKEGGSAFERHERHIKAMVKMGKIIKTGGGKGVRKLPVYEYVE